MVLTCSSCRPPTPFPRYARDDTSAPEKTFASVNVGGTRNILSAAQTAGVRAFVYVSSLGAEHGSSDYHRSKLESESHVRNSTLARTIVRPGNVYGPRDEVMPLILKMMRLGEGAEGG